LKLKKLSAKNFRGIGELDLTFDDSNIILLSGVNGSGKSSVLDCIAIMLSLLVKYVTEGLPGSFKMDSPLQAERTYEAERPVRPGSDALALMATDVREGETECRLSITAVYGGYEAPWTLTFVRKGLLSTKTSRVFDGPFARLVEMITQNAFTGQKGLPVLAYYRVERYVRDTSGVWEQGELSFERLTAYSGAIRHGGVDFKEFFKWFRYREDLENETRIRDASHRDRQMECVRTAIARMVPGFSEPRVLRGPPRMVITKKDEATDSSKELQINQLSGGEKGLISLVADLARRLAIANPDLKDPLAAEGVILIDEIDLHLHPEWQRMILPSLERTFPGCQFIVTTHSPQVISELETASLYILRDSSEGVTVEGPTRCYGRDSNRILEELMGVPERPTRVQEELKEYFRLIDDGNIREAKEARRRLEELIGTDDPEFAGADVILRGREILGG
jgi:predicted ATP-binding protein involved in virulence